MAHWAKVEDGVVTQVNVVEDDFIKGNPQRYTGTWIKTSYNTHGGVNNRVGGEALHKNYAGIGYHYDGVGFYAPQPFPSWTKMKKLIYGKPQLQCLLMARCMLGMKIV
jgi:hypothetical protein